MVSMKIAIAMSGGVDSSLAAYLLQKEGHDVFGLFMKNWEETRPDGTCHAQEDQHDAQRVCAQLGIACYTVNFTKQYQEKVFSSFLTDLKAGLTPNPDILCNKEIKFKVLYDKAMSLGADKLATGHYCREENGKLLKGLDPSKDQSYFLYAIKKHILSNVLFPIGHLEKTEVRKKAKESGIAVHSKKDSMGICFIGKRNFSEFISQYLPYQEGDAVLPDGTLVGKHRGTAFYTIGQRKGLGIGGPGDAYFVVDKDIKNNKIIVAQGKNHPALFAPTLIANQVSWIGEAPSLPFDAEAKIRYRSPAEKCTVSEDNGNLLVTFEKPQRAITAGQSVVFYQGSVCLGGAIITSIKKTSTASS
ncbi:tRNA 2-thiouridine(34) synthase MnmA [Candidatus Aerophobetes bacterium]|uniref:tRNA-specific 2-thiouridylase MnmA n=1 Tax=Aerophobetes bacterium TaxID=2030807 RepID=A0A2A4X3M9_UNCAE|nr:MAG: tRNA 2-thiouridine(34) synthase MnmA [Candidatus Aerophobetes bacterium]